jgi:hypothetical protein
MKKSSILTFMVLTFMVVANAAFAQKIATWIGGTPGQEHAWTTAKNWSNNRVPDQFTTVVIKTQNTGHQAQPYITEKVVVAELNVYAGAALTIHKTGVLEINGEQYYSQGIAVLNGTLLNQGQIFIKNIDTTIEDDLLASIKGNGGIHIISKTNQPTADNTDRR